MTLSRRAKLVLALLLVGTAAAGGAVYYALGTPYYSLYSMMRAMRRGDAAGVARFIDIDRLAAHVVASQAQRVAQARGSGRDDWDKMQNDVQARYVQLASAALLQYAGEEMRKTLGRIGTTPAKASSDDWGFKGVTYSDDVARIQIVRKSDQKIVGFEMQRQADRAWKIIRANPDEMAALLQ